VETRTFTAEEANAALAKVRPLAEEMVRERKGLADAQAKQEELATAIRGNGGGIEPSLVGELEAKVNGHAAAVARCIRRIHALGAQVKDLDSGLIDFPALRKGEIVLLCWQLGEDEIGFWHRVDDGFAGRRPLPL
jgi:hypothetical protein